ncbi:MAG TPA: riboflavin synthase [bacterium]|jgi:riboflavin synthase|nr:riboflavin synthase [bacterium]MDX9806554.1 riboflavin synthase [bacterium]HNZ54743.1 riboflavin synthase [bacterium]HOG44455.1 riboflavin synthase [bacterium]HPG35239.1 riboflavin synthase [bacterium]
MFTGIIEKTSVVKKIISSGNEYKLTIENPFSNEIKPGDSIAVDGVCLTVEKFSETAIDFFISKVTALKTIAAKYSTGSIVNLERAMNMNGRFDGHIVQGHIDTTGVISNIRKIGLGIEMTFRYDRAFSKFIISGGSIAVNGISLTAASVDETSFTVSLIPETLKRTSFSKQLKTGVEVNLEFDIIGKYVAGLIDNRKGVSNLGSLLEKL